MEISPPEPSREEPCWECLAKIFPFCGNFHLLGMLGRKSLVPKQPGQAQSWVFTSLGCRLHIVLGALIPLRPSPAPAQPPGNKKPIFIFHSPGVSPQLRNKDKQSDSCATSGGQSHSSLHWAVFKLVFHKKKREQQLEFYPPGMVQREQLCLAELFPAKVVPSSQPTGKTQPEAWL